MKKEKELFFNTLIIAIGKFSSQIIIFLMLPLYTNFLSAAEYGIYDTLLAVATFIFPFVTLLLEESMFRFLIDCKDDKSKNSVISITFFYHLISLMLFTMIYSILNVMFNIPYNLLFYLYIIAYVIHGLSNAIARGESKIKLYSLSNFITNVLIVIFNILTIVVWKFGVNGLFISFTVANIITSLWVFKKTNIFKSISLKIINKSLAKEMLRYSIPLVPNSISWSIINVSDRIMLANMISSSANGIYSVSNKFPQIVGSAYNYFSIAWKESASKAMDDKEYYNLIFEKIFAIIIIVSSIILLVLPSCYNWFVGDEYLSSYVYVPILIIAMMFSNISEFLGGIFIAYKNSKTLCNTSIFTAILNIVINIFLIKKMGIWATCISTIISTFYIMMYRFWLLRKKYEMKFKLKKVHFVLLISLIVSLAVFYIKNIVIQIFLTLLIVMTITYVERMELINITNMLRRKWKK